jgi:type IX secretion system PorP/SprF family membrane protein
MFDKATPTLQANLHLNYAYHVPLNYNDVKLSFGLGAKLMYHNIDFNKEDLPLGEDPAFSTSAYDKTLADASSGVYLYGNNFYVGFSVSNMFQSSFNDEVQGSPYLNSEYRNYYGIGAYKFQVINNDWQFEPSILIRKMQYQKGLTDITTRIIYLENNWAGLAYRNNGTAIFSFGFGAKNMHVSYSYDHSFSGKIMQYTYGTHEIGLSFRIPTKSSLRHTGSWGY